MGSNLLFDFSVDKENKTINITKEFKAGVERVWDAWTKSELLDQWWAPKPYRVETKSMDFREGGVWLYAMISPENDAHWCRADYSAIKLNESFSALDAFCDEAGTINTAFPRSLWTNTFTANGPHTTVSIAISYTALSDLEKIIEMGFKEGFTMGLSNLDELLEAQG